MIVESAFAGDIGERLVSGTAAGEFVQGCCIDLVPVAPQQACLVEAQMVAGEQAGFAAGVVDASRFEMGCYALDGSGDGLAQSAASLSA